MKQIWEYLSRIWKKSDLFSAIIEIDRILKEGTQICPVKFKKVFQLFELENVDEDNLEDVTQELFSLVPTLTLDDLSEYYKAALQGTNSRSNRIIRGQVMRKMLLASFVD